MGDSKGHRGWRLRAVLAGATGLVLGGCAELPQPKGTHAPADMGSHSTLTLPADSELLTASVDLVGIFLGSIESRTCLDRSSQRVALTTRMQSSPLVSLVKNVNSEAETQLSAREFTPSYSEYTFVEGDVVRHYTVRHREGSFRHRYDNGRRQSRSGTSAVPQGKFPHDLHSAVLAIRRWRPKLGERGAFFSVLGRRLWRVDLEARGVEVISVDGNPQLARRIDGRAARLPLANLPTIERSFTLWLSEGPERVPLRMVASSKLGEVNIRLTSRRTALEACPGGSAQPAASARLGRHVQ